MFQNDFKKESRSKFSKFNRTNQNVTAGAKVEFEEAKDRGKPTTVFGELKLSEKLAE